MNRQRKFLKGWSKFQDSNFQDKFNINFVLKDTVLTLFQYPREIEKFEYDPHFAIRGLHCDIGKVKDYVISLHSITFDKLIVMWTCSNISLASIWKRF